MQEQEGPIIRTKHIRNKTTGRFTSDTVSVRIVPTHDESVDSLPPIDPSTGQSLGQGKLKRNKAETSGYGTTGEEMDKSNDGRRVAGLNSGDAAENE